MQKMQAKNTAPVPTPARSAALVPTTGPTDETQVADLSTHAKVDTWFAFNCVNICFYDVLFGQLHFI